MNTWLRTRRRFTPGWRSCPADTSGAAGAPRSPVRPCWSPACSPVASTCPVCCPQRAENNLHHRGARPRPRPRRPREADLQKAWDAYFAAGYDYEDAEKLAVLWKSTDQIGNIKAEAGRRLLAGETLPFVATPNDPEPEVTADPKAEARLRAYFAAGYDWDDAVKLARIWKLDDPSDAKIKGGKLLLAGKKLPVKPDPANVAEAKEEARVDGVLRRRLRRRRRGEAGQDVEAGRRVLGQGRRRQAAAGRQEAPDQAVTARLHRRTGFEIELMAPPGVSRRTLAQDLAARCGGQVRSVWHHDSEPSLVPGLGRFLHLTQGFEVRRADGDLLCTLVDDVTLLAGLNPRAAGAAGLVPHPQRRSAAAAAARRAQRPGRRSPGRAGRDGRALGHRGPADRRRLPAGRPGRSHHRAGRAAGRRTRTPLRDHHPAADRRPRRGAGGIARPGPGARLHHSPRGRRAHARGRRPVPPAACPGQRGPAVRALAGDAADGAADQPGLPAPRPAAGSAGGGHRRRALLRRAADRGGGRVC